MPSGMIWQPMEPMASGRRSLGSDANLHVYRVEEPLRFNMNKFAAVGNLKKVWNSLKETGGRAPGSDGIQFDKISGVELMDLLPALSNSLRTGTYTPQPVRVTSFPKPNGKLRTLSIQCVFDRLVAKTFQLCFNNYWRSQLPRLGESIGKLYRRLEVDVRRSRRFVLAIDDIENCFPNTRLPLALECQYEHFSLPALQHLAKQIIYGHEGLMDENTGVGQGSPYSPVLVESFLHRCFDTPLDAEIGADVSLYRYMDNICMLVESHDVGTRAIEHAKSVLNPLGYSLKQEDDFIDLRDDTHQTLLLGLIPKWRNEHIHFDISDKAFGRLDKALQDATHKNLPNLQVTSVISGWIAAYAPGLMTNTSRDESIDRILSLTHQMGIHLSRYRIHDRVALARKKWMECSSNGSSS